MPQGTVIRVTLLGGIKQVTGRRFSEVVEKSPKRNGESRGGPGDFGMDWKGSGLVSQVEGPILDSFGQVGDPETPRSFQVFNGPGTFRMRSWARA